MIESPKPKKPDAAQAAIAAIQAMPNTPIPERSIQFSPSLAAAIGVDAAILLQHVQLLIETQALDASSHCNDGTFSESIRCNYASLGQQLPFWNSETLRRILHELCALGMLKLSGQVQSAEQWFYIALDPASHSPSPTAPLGSSAAKQPPLVNAALQGASKMLNGWRPETAALQLLEQNGVSAEFANSQLEEFVFYWRERGEAQHAWSSKFVQHVMHRWQTEQNRLQRERAKARAAAEASSSASQAEAGWQPSPDALEILQRMGISENFIADAIPEFVLYWREQGAAQNTWNSKFVAHTKRQWARYTNTLKHDTEPKPLPDNWQPDGEVYDVLKLANIDAQFAKQLLPEFVMYWRDRGELHHSWNTRFLQFVKYNWSKGYFTAGAESPGGESNGNSRAAAATRKTRDVSLAERLSDRSWAQ